MDRFDYSPAMADSWKQQTLLNIVKLRYMDLPVFVDVASVVAGYSMQTCVSVNGTLSSAKAMQGDFASVGGQAIYTDRPTITYVPLTGANLRFGNKLSPRLTASAPSESCAGQAQVMLRRRGNYSSRFHPAKPGVCER